MVKPKI